MKTFIDIWQFGGGRLLPLPCQRLQCPRGAKASRGETPNNAQKASLHLRLVLPRSEKKRKIVFFGKFFHFGRNTKVGFTIIFAPSFVREAVF